MKQFDMKNHLIDPKDLPKKLASNRAKWLATIQDIPPGKILHLTEAEAEMKAISVTTMVRDFIKNHLLPDHYNVSRWTDEKKTVHIYIKNARPPKQ